MLIQTERKGNVIVTRLLINRFISIHVNDFKAKLGRHIDHGETKIVLDLSHVDFIDSNGMSAIVSVFKTFQYKLSSAGMSGDMIVCGLNESVMEMFELTRMNRVFKTFKTAKDAVNYFE